jgi:predicted phage terminase large subunit-like protein
LPELNQQTIDNAKITLSREFLWDFCQTKAPEFYKDNCIYLEEICKEMQDFLTNDVELLVINMPPRFGKSRTATLGVQWYLGKDPSLKIMTGSYNEKLSRTFSKQTRNSIQEKKLANGRIVYSDIFPDTQIKHGDASVEMWRLENTQQTSYLAVSPSSSATGFGADIIIIDDIIKNKYEASNATILDGHYEWFTDTLYSRLEGKRKIMLIMTRWATKDLAGRVLELYEEKGRNCKLLTKKANDNGILLNKDILNEEQYNHLINTIGEDIVEANYNQNPIDLKGKLYEYQLTYKESDITIQNGERNPKVIFIGTYSHCDTADEGSDYLCNIIYGKTRDNKCYILDVYYTQESMETTEKETAKRLTDCNVTIWSPESNNGGRGFARAVEREYKLLGNRTTACKWYHQSKNKNARIISNSTLVMNSIYYPENWKQRWPVFYSQVTTYQREGKNKHDDAPDVLTAIVESIQSTNTIKFG